MANEDYLFALLASVTVLVYYVIELAINVVLDRETPARTPGLQTFFGGIITGLFIYFLAVFFLV